MGDKPGTIKIELAISIGLVGCTRKVLVEVDRDEWADMDDQEKDDYMHQELFNVIEWGFSEMED